MLHWFHQFGSPPYFQAWARRFEPWFAIVALILIGYGWFAGLFLAPPDCHQGDAFRIIYVHVPSAWLSLFVFTCMAVAGFVALVWHTKVAEIFVAAAAPIGASFTFLALVSGAIWGKPMWGAWWVWDARLTSELILLFLYLGVIALGHAIENTRTAGRAASLLAVVGVVNVPIIHYSVQWWNTLHQGPTVTRFDAPAMASSMLIPLLASGLGFMCLFGWLVLARMRAELMMRKRNSIGSARRYGEQ